MRTKDAIVSRLVSLLTFTTTAVPPSALPKEDTQARTSRSVCLAIAAYAASVLDNAFGRLTYEEREAAFQRCDDYLAEFACWPFGSNSVSNGAGERARRREGGSRIGMGSERSGGREAVLGLVLGAELPRVVLERRVQRLSCWGLTPLRQKMKRMQLALAQAKPE